jgi:membrane protein
MTKKRPSKQNNSSEGLNLIDELRLNWKNFKEWIWQNSAPDDQLGTRMLRGGCRIIFIVTREAQDDRITLRASALTFTVVLSLVPMLALGTAVLKGLGAGDQMRIAAYKFIEQFESAAENLNFVPDQGQPPAAEEPEKASNQIPGQEQPLATDAPGKISTPVPDSDGQAAEQESESGNLTGHLHSAVDKIFDYVDRTNFTTLGTIGIIGMVLAALGVVGSIEQSMNAIWQTRTGRALGRKIIDYMALMILLPISVNLALATGTAMQSNTLYTKIQVIMPAMMFGFILKLLPVLILILTFTLLYRFIPNTRVEYIPALAGGIFGGLSWYLVQIIYIKLQIGVAKYNAIYGSFATLPLFFLWIYVAWVVFLLGAEVAFAFQVWKQYQWEKVRLSPVVRLAMAFDIMEAALNDFTVRRVTNKSSLARHLGQPDNAISVIVNELSDGGMLRRVSGKLEGYVPAAPSAQLKPVEIMDIIFGKDIPEVLKGCGLANKALKAARQSLDKLVIDCHQQPPLADKDLS